MRMTKLKWMKCIDVLALAWIAGWLWRKHPEPQGTTQLQPAGWANKRPPGGGGHP